jgi:tRNA G18 (ribose-2'-O)-methylase SpoU
MKKLLNNELNRLTPEEFRKAEKHPVSVILDNVRSQHNIGSIFRTCDAFLIETLFLCGITSTPPHREIHKTALGATESVHWEYAGHTADVVMQLKEKGYRIVAVEQTETSIPLHAYRCNNGTKYALVFGHEIRGVDQSVVDLCDESLEIPQLGTKHSVNIAVSAGIVLWEFFRFFRT